MFPNKQAYHRILVCMLCLLPLLLTACSLFGGEKPLVKAPANKQIYTIPEVGIAEFDTLDPALAHDPASIRAIQMVFTGLVQLNDKLQIAPQLAQSWETNSDGTVWTFHLQSKLKFSDGTPLTAKDIAYSIDRALQPTTQSTVAPLYLGLIKDADQLVAGRIPTLINDSLQTPDDTTLIITTRKKAGYFLSMLTHPCAYVVEKTLIDKYGKKFTNHLSEGGSSGPFKVAQYERGKGLSLSVNKNYYHTLPQLQKVMIAFYPTADEAYQAYKGGRVDTTGVPLSTLSVDKKGKDFHQIPQLWINYYTMNYLVKPFDNIHIRQAFALAIDKTAITNKIWNGTALATNHIIPEGMTGYNTDLKGPDGTQSLKGDPAKAKSLLQQGLQEEGWTNVSEMPALTLTYASNVAPFEQEVKEVIQMWQTVLNVTVTPQPLEYNTLLDKVTASTNNADGLQMWGLAWVAEYPDPQDWLSLQFGRGVPNNNMNYGQNTGKGAAQQQITQQALESADSNLQPDARLRSYQQSEQQLVSDVAWLPMEQEQATFLRSPFIKGIVDNAQGIIPPDSWKNIYRVE